MREWARRAAFVEGRSGEGMHTEFYRQAEYYDIAFSYRDVRKETDFFYGVWDRHARRPLKSALELCCGPGYHALELARRGVSSAGLDLSADMVRVLDEKARAERLAVTAHCADMRDFALPRRFDLALNLLTSISYLLTNEDVLRHFGAVADHLEDGGLYLVENNHPRDFFEGDHFRPSRWTMERDGVVVETTWMARPPRINLVDQTYEVTARYEVDDKGKKLAFEDQAPLRMLLPPEMRLMAAQKGLALVGAYGDFSLGQPLDDSDRSWRTIAVFQKAG